MALLTSSCSKNYWQLKKVRVQQDSHEPRELKVSKSKFIGDPKLKEQKVSLDKAEMPIVQISTKERLVNNLSPNPKQRDWKAQQKRMVGKQPWILKNQITDEERDERRMSMSIVMWALMVFFFIAGAFGLSEIFLIISALAGFVLTYLSIRGFLLDKKTGRKVYYALSALISLLWATIISWIYIDFFLYGYSY